MAARVIPLLLAALLLIGASAAAGNAAGKVDVALYYESLCPFSARFVVNHLARIFKNGLLDAADLTLVPYGNARVGKDGAISCQHGRDECFLNTVEACAIAAWPNLTVHFGFIYCVEKLVVNHMHHQWESCFKKLGLDPKPVTECYKSERGYELELEYGRQTDALQPPHKYVPWVVVDGQPLYDVTLWMISHFTNCLLKFIAEAYNLYIYASSLLATNMFPFQDYENFEAYICKAYKGRPPRVCEGLGRRPPSVVEAGSGVSYNSGDIKLEHAEDGTADEIKMVLADDDN